MVKHIQVKHLLLEEINNMMDLFHLLLMIFLIKLKLEIKIINSNYLFLIFKYIY